MQKLLAYSLWIIVIALILITVVSSVVKAEGCDSATNSNCIETNSTTTSTVNSNLKSETTLKSPPSSAMAPSLSASNSDSCVTYNSSALQTQIFGISFGSGAIVDQECLTMKRVKLLSALKMSVASVSLLCSSSFDVFTAMKNAGSICPYEGKTGAEAQALWDANPHRIPGYVQNPKTKEWSNEDKSIFKGVGSIGGLFLALLLLL